MTIPQRFTNGDATFYVLVVSDDMGTADDEGGNAIVWEHQFSKATELREVLKRQRSLGGRYGTSWIAECRIIPETCFATVKESLTAPKIFTSEKAARAAGLSDVAPAAAEECSATRQGPQVFQSGPGPVGGSVAPADARQDQGALIEALIAAGIARTPLEAHHAVAICADHLHKSGGLVAWMGAKELREQAGLWTPITPQARRTNGMAEIIQRHAWDGFRALQVARGMEEAGCCVFSITYVSSAHPMQRWIVWGRFHPTEIDVDVIDRCIESSVFPASEGPEACDCQPRTCLVPITERAPMSQELDTEGRCWVFDPFVMPGWILMPERDREGRPFLPHWCLQVPDQEANRA